MMNKPLIKICGITQPAILQFCRDKGVDLAGLIFYPASPRYITLEKARSLLRSVNRKKMGITGVFVDETVDRVREIAEYL
ncbi:MAG: phosphoribosylanthranilate isomerase, partial [bacterium]|nr:phosphoribosylanthranilate isomerase [bacterium]